MDRRLVVLPTRSDVEEAVAAAVLVELANALRIRERAHLVVTGGTVGIGTLAAMARHPLVSSIDWALVHVWWGDERFVADGDPDRNDRQAVDAIFAGLPMPRENLHPFPSDRGQSVEQARTEFLDAHAEGFPEFDVVLNGIGPDGHVASLFPGFEHGSDDELVIAVRNSPKLPPERLSFTFTVLNNARKVWIVAAGTDKADAIRRLMSDAGVASTPACGLRGQVDTTVWVDAAAASELDS